VSALLDRVGEAETSAIASMLTELRELQVERDLAAAWLAGLVRALDGGSEPRSLEETAARARSLLGPLDAAEREGLDAGLRERLREQAETRRRIASVVGRMVADGTLEGGVL
jgi:hypothetical protein